MEFIALLLALVYVCRYRGLREIASSIEMTTDQDHHITHCLCMHMRSTEKFSQSALVVQILAVF